MSVSHQSFSIARVVEQQSRDGSVSVHGSVVERSEPSSILDLDPRSSADQRFHHILVPES